jgi:hypothetical protein
MADPRQESRLVEDLEVSSDRPASWNDSFSATSICSLPSCAQDFAKLAFANLLQNGQLRPLARNLERTELHPSNERSAPDERPR